MSATSPQALQRKGFIPLADLLKRNHADRVQQYLANLEEEDGETDKFMNAAKAQQRTTVVKNEIKDAQIRLG